MALHLNYPDTSAAQDTDFIGRVMGPDLHGAHYVAVTAERDGDGWRVRLMPLPEGETRLTIDDFRQVWLPRHGIADDGTIRPLEVPA